MKNYVHLELAFQGIEDSRKELIEAVFRLRRVIVEDDKLFERIKTLNDKLDLIETQLVEGRDEVQGIWREMFREGEEE